MNRSSEIVNVMMRLTLGQAQVIISAALAQGRRASMRPLTVVVLDARAFVVASTSEEDFSLRSFEVAKGKSNGAIIGAVGVSGDNSDNDEIAASAGIEAAGLTADGG